MPTPRRVHRPVSFALLALVLAGCAGARAPAASAGEGRGEDLTFTLGSPLVADIEVARRALTPLTFLALERNLEASGTALRSQPVDLSREAFHLYVPAGPPPAKGWGLLVYIAPWEELVRPRLYRPALDRRRMAMVTFAGAGNQASILDRRMPLAVLAAVNVQARLPVDPERVYVGGFSGGSRSAEITLLSYPELFRGALLHAGSDPPDGSTGTYTPSRERFGLVQQRRIVQVTGEHDELHVGEDALARSVLRERCVFDVGSTLVKNLAHDALPVAACEKALDLLEERTPPAPARLAACNARLEAEVRERLDAAEAAVNAGDREKALKLLKELDARYGGLAAPRSVELEKRRQAL